MAALTLTIDVGGTHMKAAVVDEAGELREPPARIDTVPRKPAPGLPPGTSRHPARHLKQPPPRLPFLSLQPLYCLNGEPP